MKENEVVSLGKTYSARGNVIGYPWGSNDLYFYESKDINKQKSKKDIYKKISEGIKDGSLHSGFGFESIKFAEMKIEEEHKIKYKNKIYSSKKCELKYFDRNGIIDKEIIDNELNLYYK